MKKESLLSLVLIAGLGAAAVSSAAPPHRGSLTLLPTKPLTCRTGIGGNPPAFRARIAAEGSKAIAHVTDGSGRRELAALECVTPIPVESSTLFRCSLPEGAPPTKARELTITAVSFGIYADLDGDIGYLGEIGCELPE